MGPGRCENAGGSQSASMLRATTYLCDGLGAARPFAVGQPRSVAGEDIDPSCTGAGAGAGELRYAGAATPTPSVSHSAVGARRTARVAGG
eukprot:COSAG01_NODE_185_length_22691_cov_53.142478_14_plen_90_part_00